MVTIPRVCQRFRALTDTEWFWRAHFVRLRGGAQPMVELESMRLWQEGCLQRELALEIHRNAAAQDLLQGVYGDVDCVHILKSSEMHGASVVVAAGSRDTSVYVWRKRATQEGSESTQRRKSMRNFTMATLNGHKGWVWSLASERTYRPHLLCSGSWDRHVKIWDVSVGECAATIERHHRAAVLSLCIPERDCLVSACNDKTVRVIDLRETGVVQAQHTWHKRSVLSVVGSERYIYSASEDCTVCVWDRRKNDILQRLQFPGIVPSLHLHGNILSLATASVVKVEDEVSEYTHDVYLHHCSGGHLEQLQHFVSGHSQQMTAVVHCHGLLATASKDGCVHVYTPASPPTLYSVLERRTHAITDLDLYNNTLAVAKGRNVSLWAL